MTAHVEPNLDEGRHQPPVDHLIANARRACVMHRASFEGTDPQSVRVPAAAVEELVQSLTGTAPQRIQQIVPFASRARHQRVFAGIWRQLAGRCEVERYYLVPAGEENQLKASKVVEEDQRFSLDSKSVSVMGWNQPVQVPMSDLWLIDGRVVVRQELGGGGVASWLVSGHDHEVQEARAALTTLMRAHLAQQNRVVEPGRAVPDLTDWMLESAQMLYHLAPMSCTGSRYIDPDGCRWYHGAWQYLRLFDMVSSPNWHTQFYAGQLREEIGRGARKILISGAADYTTLAFVLHAARDAAGDVPADLEVHVLDLCQTPLLACQWYAGRLDLKITMHRADAIDPDDLCRVGLLSKVAPSEVGGSFDLIVADAFLTRFTLKEAQQVVQNWFRLLRPSGRVVTTVRLHPRNDYRGHEPADIDANDRYRVTDPTDDFELRLRERAAGWSGMLSIDLDDLSRAGRQYAERMKSHDLGDADQIAKIFIEQDFEVVNQAAERVDGELVGTEYLRVTASRQ